MRLWSLDPSHLDSKGLVALWREALLARAVLLGLTKGYKNYPQLERFKDSSDPLISIDFYLSRVLDEAQSRGYKFTATKIQYSRTLKNKIFVTDSQIDYEWKHFLKKLKDRSPEKYKIEKKLNPTVHPCFICKHGPIASWEKI